jgi:tRNA splicing endonuclease
MLTKVHTSPFDLDQSLVRTRGRCIDLAVFKNFRSSGFQVLDGVNFGGDIKVRRHVGRAESLRDLRDL